MSSQSRAIHRTIASVAAIAWVAAIAASMLAAQRPEPAAQGVMPAYDAGGNLVLPGDYRQWVLVGTSINLGYAEGRQGSRMFHATLMEPTAYRHFVQTGEFREGTMLALILQGIGSGTPPARQGQFATDVHAVEMAVKDSSRVPERWAYYDFGGPMTGGLRNAVAPQPKTGCYSCHVEHAALDHVFTQFYGLLNDVAPPSRQASGARQRGGGDTLRR